MPKARPAAVARLWAPWRTGFITGKPPRGCIFCRARAARDDRQHLVVRRGRHAFALLNLYPYNNGHVMITPHRHVGDFAKLKPAEWAEMLTLSQQLIAQLRRQLHPHGFNLGLNIGRPAGAGIPGHLHLHVVPRWNGDTNFMPILGQTKVMSQSLAELHRLLHARRR